ncbi:hypothetical protein C6H64_22070 [Photorhabdus luminescens]|nr:hypothetical protein C6H64_22070 [Photorhabdus luminescens]
MNNKSSSLLFVVLMAFLSMGGLVSSDIFLPALSKMGNYYHVSESSIQSAIAIFLFGIYPMDFKMHRDGKGVNPREHR